MSRQLPLTPFARSRSFHLQAPTSHHAHRQRARPRGRLALPSWGAAASPPAYRPPTYTPYHIFATTFDLNYEGLPSSSSSAAAAASSSSADAADAALAQGLAAWIPSPASVTEPYDLYVIAVQRCRALARLRQALQEHLGGPARYVLAGSAEVGDALYGKMAVLVFARASDVESGAFRLLGSNQRPVVLRAMRGGCKVRGEGRKKGRKGGCLLFPSLSVHPLSKPPPPTTTYTCDRALRGLPSASTTSPSPSSPPTSPPPAPTPARPPCSSATSTWRPCSGRCGSAGRSTSSGTPTCSSTTVGRCRRGFD